MNRETCILTISFIDRIKIRLTSFAFGTIIICKMLIKWLWDSKAFTTIQQRKNPPLCLVDSFLGQHKYIKYKGVKFHYVEAGQQGQPLVVLLHGFPDCWLSWRHQILELATHNFHVIALDLKGFGDSDKPSKRNDYRMDKIVEELCGVITTFGVKHCTIVGHDIGAILGWYLAQQCPAVVEKLVAVSCPHPNELKRCFSETSNYRWLNFVQLPYLPEIDALKDDVKIIADYHKHLTNNDVYLEAYKYAFSRKVDWSGALNYHRCLPYFEVAGDANAIQLPVLLIIGNKDRCINLESIVKSTEYCEKFEVKIVENAEHFPHQERPAAFNAILVKFLTKDSTQNRLNPSPGGKGGLMNMMFGAVTNTVKYGNSVIDTVVQKKPLHIGMPSMSLLNSASSSSAPVSTMKTANLYQ